MLFRSLLIAAASAVFVHADDSAAIAPEDSSVVKLNGENFEDFVSTHPLVLAEFFAPWCGHCKHLGPEYVAAADVLAKKDIPLVQVDCTQERDLCSKYDVRGYPTVKVFRGAPDAFTDYPGERKSDSIVSYMIKQSLPAVSVFDDAAELQEAIDNLKDVIVLQVLPEGVTVGNDTFFTIANSLRDDFTFFSTNNSEFVDKYAPKSGKRPGYVIFRPDEESSDASIFEGKIIDKDNLVDFIKVEAKPLFGEVNGGSFRAYMAADIPLAYYFYNEVEQRGEVASLMQKLAREYRGKINFAGLDASKFGVHAKNLNMEEKFPLFVIHDVKENLKYGISQDTELDNDKIPDFVADFVAGKLDPIVKSEPIPEVQNSSVYHLVGYEHDKIIALPKDVLVKYYAPWCGHCKRLAPIFKALADVYAADEASKDKVVLAEIDHTANDIPGVDIQGYPTLILYPADGSEPVEFQGQRTLEGMANFIKEKGSLNIDGVALHDEQEAVRKAEEEKKAAEEEAEEEKQEEQADESVVDSASSSEETTSTTTTTTAAAVSSGAEKAKEAPKTEEKTEEADPMAAVYAKIEEAKQFVLKEKDTLLAKVQGVINGENHDEL